MDQISSKVLIQVKEIQTTEHQKIWHQLRGGNVDNVSHEKNTPTFHYTGWLIGILIMVYYNPYING